MQVPRASERVRAEEDPREADEVEGREPRRQIREARSAPLDEAGSVAPPALEREPAPWIAPQTTNVQPRRARARRAASSA